MLTVDFFELPMWSGELDDAADWLVALVDDPAVGGTLVTHINMHNRYALQRRPWVLDALRTHGQVFFEGIGMQLGLWLRGGPTVGGINGTDLFPLVMERAARAAIPVFFLGGSHAVVQRAAQSARERWPGLVIAGARGGYFPVADEEAAADVVAASGARLVLIGRGCPIQEEFAVRWRAKLAPAVLWSVGGLFDFVSGRTPRAPAAMRAARLEWLYRLGREPRRMWRRALVEGPLFLADVARSRQ